MSGYNFSLPTPPAGTSAANFYFPQPPALTAEEIAARNAIIADAFQPAGGGGGGGAARPPVTRSAWLGFAQPGGNLEIIPGTKNAYNQEGFEDGEEVFVLHNDTSGPFRREGLAEMLNRNAAEGKTSSSPLTRRKINSAYNIKRYTAKIKKGGRRRSAASRRRRSAKR